MGNSQDFLQRWPAYREIVHALRLIVRNPLTASGLSILSLMVIVAIFQTRIAPYDPLGLDLGNRLTAPSVAHLFGTDGFGRDIFSRIIYGTRISLTLATSVVFCGMFLGSFLGICAGYLGGWIDEVVMRVTDIFMAFPAILLAMVIVTALQPSLFNAGLTLVIIGWPEYARVMRGQTLSIMQNEFVTAAESLGASRWRIMRKHIFPNCIGPLIVQATLSMGVAVLSAAALGFLGLGAQEPTPEWGLMISKGRQFFLDAWWYPVFPGCAIALTVLAFNFLGDGLRDILDPRVRR
jgi:peptide/nickel transport system permease protein